MTQVYVLAHNTVHREDMSAGSSQEAQLSSKGTTMQSSEADFFEIEVFKSQLVTVASCDFEEETEIGDVENIRYKSCGNQLPTDSVKDMFRPSDMAHKLNSNDTRRTSEHKARRFKRISLQWLLKPSRKASHSSSRIRRVNGQGKQRIMRINSAPKTFGQNGKSANELTDFKKNSAQRSVSESCEHGVRHDRGQTSSRDTRKIRRISLPAPVMDSSGRMVDKRHAKDEFITRTPEPRRKHVVEFDELFIQTLKLNDSQGTGDKDAKKSTTNRESQTEDGSGVAGQDLTEKFIPTREPRDTFLHLKNVKKENGKPASHPVLKLHKFHNPDIFYMPLLDDESQTTGPTFSHKLCRARLIEPRTNNSLLQECVKDELQSYLSDKQFCSRSCQRWCLELSQNIKAAVHRMKQCECKIACVVYIAALRGHGVHAATQSILIPQEDDFITVNLKNRSMIAIASVLAIKYV